MQRNRQANRQTACVKNTKTVPENYFARLRDKSVEGGVSRELSKLRSDFRNNGQKLLPIFFPLAMRSEGADGSQAKAIPEYRRRRGSHLRSSFRRRAEFPPFRSVSDQLSHVCLLKVKQNNANNISPCFCPLIGQAISIFGLPGKENPVLRRRLLRQCGSFTAN